jgi:hypothetical protein
MILVSSFVTIADRLVSGGDFAVKDLGKHHFSLAWSLGGYLL